MNTNKFIIRLFLILVTIRLMPGCANLKRVVEPEYIEPPLPSGKECVERARQGKEDCVSNVDSERTQCFPKAIEQAEEIYNRQLTQYEQNIKDCDNEYQKAMANYRQKQDNVENCRQSSNNNEDYARCGRGFKQPDRRFYCLQYSTPDRHDIISELTDKCDSRFKNEERRCRDKFDRRWKDCGGQILYW